MKKIYLFLLLLFIMTGCQSKQLENPVNWDIDNFTYKDQDNQSFSKKDLKGRVWIASFIYTNCPDVCQPITQNVSNLKKYLEKEKIANVEFVSFSVDPEVDTPEKLKNFASIFKIDFTDWHFLTGYKQAEIEQFAQENFHTIVQKPNGQDQVTHGTDIYLVNQEGMVVQYYDGFKKVPSEQIANDIKILQDQKN